MKKTSSKKVDCMRIESVDIFNSFFTKKRIANWIAHLANCSMEMADYLTSKVDPQYGVQYFLNEALLKEVVGDAIVGMRKIIDTTPHPVEEPNAFKIAAYLSYWFIRHKPISILYPPKVDLDRIEIAAGITSDPKYLSWQLKHINESVAVNIATSFIFDFESVLCDEKQCEKIKKKNQAEGMSCFVFDNYTQQRSVMLQKLTYYFTYRAIAPKIIEHLLEGFAFHPAWNLTGPHWRTNMGNSITQASILPDEADLGD